MASSSYTSLGRPLLWLSSPLTSGCSDLSGSLTILSLGHFDPRVSSSTPSAYEPLWVPDAISSGASLAGLVPRWPYCPQVLCDLVWAHLSGHLACPYFHLECLFLSVWNLAHSSRTHLHIICTKPAWFPPMELMLPCTGCSRHTATPLSWRHSIFGVFKYFHFPGWIIHLKRKGVLSSLPSQCLVYGRCLLNAYLKDC